MVNSMICDSSLGYHDDKEQPEIVNKNFARSVGSESRLSTCWIFVLQKLRHTSCYIEF